MKPLRLGTRGSRLAVVQSELVAKRLQEIGFSVELVTIVSDGDLRAPDTPIGEGIFVTALERALVDGAIDLAVHSAKDLPLDENPELVIAAYPERADPRDALVARNGASSIQDLAPHARVGTDSPRRAGFLRAIRADLEVIPLHGNVDTRLRRLESGEADALVLAAAGLDRLGFGGRIAARLDPESMPPAPGQGALAVQARREDHAVLGVLKALDDAWVRMAVVAERAVLKAVGGGCQAPIGALATHDDDGLTLLVGAVTADGKSRRVLRRADVVERSLAPSACLAAEELHSTVALTSRVVIDTSPDLDPLLSDSARRHGYRVVHAPTIAIEPADGDGGLERARSRIAHYDWVVVTSRRGVQALFEGLPSAPPPTVRWAAVGPTTAKALRERGMRVDCTPAAQNADAIPKAMAAHGPVKGARVLLARADAAGRDLPEQLALMGAEVDDVVAYRTVVAPKQSQRALVQALADPDVDAIMFASGSAVRGVVELSGSDVIRARSLQVFTIGPKTSAVARGLGFKVTAEAAERDAAGLRAALTRGLEQEVERWVESQLRPPA